MALLKKYQTTQRKCRTTVISNIKRKSSLVDMHYQGGDSVETPSKIPFQLTLFKPSTGFVSADWVMGSKNVALITTDFDQLLKLLESWISQKSHHLVCQLLKRIVQNCNLRQLQMLTTVVQPVQSRSFIYTSRLTPEIRHSESPINKSDNQTKIGLNTKADPSFLDECQILIEWFSTKWNDVKRMAFLQKLLGILNTKELYYLSELIKGRQYRDFIGKLPERLSKRILTYLSTKDLRIICQVCKKWRQLASCDDIWKQKCCQTRFTLPKELIAKRYSWKDIYKDNKKLQANWAGGYCQTLELKGHTNRVLTLALSVDHVASGSSDKTVRIWCIHSGILLQTFYGHERGVWCVRFFTNNMVVSGSYDTTIRIWNIQLECLVRTLNGHQGPVWVLVCHDDLLMSTSQDKTAKLWKVSKAQLKYTLIGHKGAIFAGDLAESGDLAITGSSDKSIRLWNTMTGFCNRIITTSFPEPILALSYSHGYIAYAQGLMVTVINSVTTRLIAVCKEHEDRVETVQLRIYTERYQHPFQRCPNNIAKDISCQGMVISGSKDGFVRFWDISNGPSSSVYSFNERRCRVNCAQFDDLRIANVSNNHRIIVRDFGYSFLCLL